MSVLPLIPYHSLVDTHQSNHRTTIRKRCRQITKPAQFTGPVLVFLLVSLALLQQFTFARPFHYNSCFEQIKAADDNGDLFLSRNEYSKLLITISGGAILLQNETPPVLTYPYDSRIKSTAQELDVHGIEVTSLSTSSEDIDFVELFCHDIYIGLQSIFDVKIETDFCVSAVQSADVNPQNGNISINEYTFLVVALTLDVSLSNLSFDKLPKSLQDVFNDMEIDDEIQAKEGIEYLLDTCQRVVIAVEIDDVVYNSMPTTAPTKSPIKRLTLIPTTTPYENGPVVSPVQEPTSVLFDKLLKCKTALLGSDANRDKWLDVSEYSQFLAKLFSNGYLESSFDKLDITFRDSYNVLIGQDKALSLDKLIPGANSSRDELSVLSRICNETYNAFEIYELERNNVTPSPSQTPTNSSNKTILSANEFQTCKTYMILSDINRNSILEESEYVRFIGRLTSTIDINQISFTDLDDSFKNVYIEYTGSTSGIDIEGSKPGQIASTTQDAHLMSLCTDVNDSIAQGHRSKSPNVQSSPTEAPNVNEEPITDEFFRVCKAAMLIADINRDDELDVDEYVRFLNRLTISEFSGDGFMDLDPVFQKGFYDIVTNKTIDVYGSKPGITPSEKENSHLRAICADVNKAIEEYNDLDSQNDSMIENCTSLLVRADEDNNYLLNEMEYLKFLRLFSDVNTTQILDLPFILQDNFKWISFGNKEIDIKGSSNFTATLNGSKIRLNWICERTSRVIDLALHRTQDVALSDHCNTASKSADIDKDGFLTGNEFTLFLNIFSADEWAGYNFSSLSQIFIDSFDEFKNSQSGKLDIGTAMNNGLCERTLNATAIARNWETFLQVCNISFILSDLDKNGQLEQSEYIPFVDNLIVAYSISNASSDTVGENGNVSNINNLISQASDRNNESIREFCATTGQTFGFINNTHPINITIYNSFKVSNTVGIKAIDLSPESEQRLNLKKAYVLFLNEEVTDFSEFRGRNLAKQDSISDADIYHIEDIQCPTTEPIATCQTVFASFNISIVTNKNENTIKNLFSNKTQDSIESGALQQKLSTIDSDNLLFVLESSTPLQPYEKDQEPQEEEISSGGKTGLSFWIIIGSSIGATLFGASLFFIFRHSYRKTPNKVEVAEDRYKNESLDIENAFTVNDISHADVPDSYCQSSNKQFQFSNDRNGGQSIECPESLHDPDHASTTSSLIFKISNDNEYEYGGTNEESAFKFGNNGIIFDNVHNNDNFELPDESTIQAECEYGSTDEGIAFKFGNKFDIHDNVQNIDYFELPDESTFQSALIENHDIQYFIVENSENGVIDPNIKSIYDTRSDLAYQQSIDELQELDNVAHVHVNDNLKTFDSNDMETDAPIEEYYESSVNNISFPLKESNDNAAAIVELPPVVADDNIFNFDEEKQVSAVAIEPHFEKNIEDMQQFCDHGGTFCSSVKKINDDVGCVGDVKISEPRSEPTNSEKESQSDGDVCSESETENSERSDQTNPLDDGAIKHEIKNEIIEESYEHSMEEGSECDESVEEPSISFDEESSNNSKEQKQLSPYQLYRPMVEALVRRVVPDEIDNIDAMMEQFLGKEDELITTLRNMAGSDSDNDSTSSEECDDGSIDDNESDDEETSSQVDSTTEGSENGSVKLDANLTTDESSSDSTESSDEKSKASIEEEVHSDNESSKNETSEAESSDNMEEDDSDSDNSNEDVSITDRSDNTEKEIIEEELSEYSDETIEEEEDSDCENSEEESECEDSEEESECEDSEEE